MEERGQHHLKWPETENLKKVKSEFESSFTLPSCRGATDSTQLQHDPEPQPQGRQVKMWSEQEEIALAQSYIDHLEDPKKGNAEHGKICWSTVTKEWHERMDHPMGYRTKDQVSSKWRDICKWVGKFNDFYVEEKYGSFSGQSDEDLVNSAHTLYQQATGRVFKHIGFWMVVRDHPKWATVPGICGTSQTSKRKKTSDIAYTTSSDDAIDVEEPINPIGRDKVEKKVCSSSSVNILEDVVGLTNNFEDYYSRMDRSLEIEKERLELEKQRVELKRKKADMNADKQRTRDMQMLAMNIDHLSGQERELFLKLKQEIIQKYSM